MLWFRKRSGSAAAPPAVFDQIVPVELPVALDAALFRQHYAKLLENAGQDGGIEGWLAALAAKREAYAGACARARSAPLAMAEVEALLDRAFTARRRVYPALEQLGAGRVPELLSGLLHGAAPLARRMQDFVDALPGTAEMDRDSLRAAAKVRRAAWDFAAELVHFGDPVRYPLMTRWVWDRSTQSGALRELIRGGDALREIPFGNEPELFEGARQWLAQRIAEEGVYRDVPLWIDLVLAQAYTTYFRAATEGVLGADFGRGATVQEQMKRLLGIDAAPHARSRVKKAVMCNQ